MKQDAFVFKQKNIYLSAIYKLLIILCIATCICNIGFCVYYIESPVSGTSMMPTLNAGDVDDYVYIARTDFTRGDIIVIDTLDPNIGHIVKRVIGVAGDRIGLLKVDNEYRLTLNNRVLYEEYLLKKQGAYSNDVNNEYGMASYPYKFELLFDAGVAFKNADDECYVIVPEGKVFCLGDNRFDSVASETYGAYSLEQVVGKVEYIRHESTPKWWFVLRVITSVGSNYGRYNGYDLCNIDTYW